MSDSLNELIEQLKVTKSRQTIPSDPYHLNDDNIQEFILRKAGKLINDAVQAVEDYKDNVCDGTDAEAASSLAALIGAASGAIDTANKINLQNKKNRTAVQLREMDIEARKQLQLNEKPVSTNILIATREEVLRHLFDTPEKQKTIEAELIDKD